jgi:hypothetical protein
MQDAFRYIRDSGMWELIRSGKHDGEPSTFRPLTHKEWHARYPEGVTFEYLNREGERRTVTIRCIEKIKMPWNVDELRTRLSIITGQTVPFRDMQVIWYRKPKSGLALTDDEIVSVFRQWYPTHAAQKEAAGNRKSDWRKNVAYHFGRYLERYAADELAV